MFFRITNIQNLFYLKCYIFQFNTAMAFIKNDKISDHSQWKMCWFCSYIDLFADWQTLYLYIIMEVFTIKSLNNCVFINFLAMYFTVQWATPLWRNH